MGGHGQFHDEEGGSKDSPLAYVEVEGAGGNDVKDDSKGCDRDLGGSS